MENSIQDEEIEYWNEIMIKLVTTRVTQEYVKSILNIESNNKDDVDTNFEIEIENQMENLEETMVSRERWFGNTTCE